MTEIAGGRERQFPLRHPADDHQNVIAVFAEQANQLQEHGTRGSTKSSPATTSSTLSKPPPPKPCAPKSKATGDRRAGVVWHTQGSGKSFSMLFYAARVIREAAMENPTIVVLTDRNDIDDQLFGQFQRCQELLGQAPVQAPDRESLRHLLKVSSGGVVFTTIQKFLPETKGAKMPELSPRRNIVVIADEAHRTQYDLIDGFARHMRDALPNASFIVSV